MAVQQALEPAFVHVISAADPDRRHLSRAAGFAIAVSVAAHVALGIYIYEAKYGAPPAPIPSDPTMTTTFVPDVVVKQTPKKAPPPPPRALAVRPSRAPSTPSEPAAPFTPVVVKQLDLTEPPQLAANVVVAPPPAPPAPPAVIVNPDWLTRPGPNEFSRFYPQPALDQNASGAATLACTVSASGAVHDCSIAAETPKGLGFGDAARKLAPYFKLRPQTRDGAPVDGAHINIPIRFNLAT
jgi:periplasmic protein TonB